MTAAADHRAIQDQLDKILASAPFRHSRRCQALLKHVVTAVVDGRLDALKERVVGAEVFGREASYDTNHDAVVRNAAAEVRKRLAQYYLEPGHALELRIDLPPGSYLPEFHPPTEAPDSAPSAGPPPRRWRSAVLVTAVLSIGVAAGYLIGVSTRPRAIQRTELDEFWAPVVAASGDAQILVGQSRGFYVPGAVPTQASTDQLDLKAMIPASRLLPLRDRFIYFGDAYCLAHVNGYLESRGKSARFRGSALTPYAELRGQPAVLIGAFNNPWTMRLTEGLRFALANDGPDVRGVRDSEKPGQLVWSVAGNKTHWLTEEDYALVTRVFDANTGQVVVSTGGIGHFGTMSTGEFLSNPAYFREAVRDAPAGWARRNMQFVLKVKVADGTPGPPAVLAKHFW